MVDNRVTQIPIITVDLSNQPSRVTQIPVLAISIPVQPARITQLPVMVPYAPRPIPAPVSIPPETPVTEVWSYLTAVNIISNGREQRSALRDIPRYSLRLNFLLLNDDDRRIMIENLQRQQGVEFNYPIYQYGTPVEPADAGDTELYFDASRTDMRAGELLAIYDPYLETLTYAEIATVEPEGATLAAPLAGAVPKGCYALPVYPFRLPSPASIRMDTVAGTATMRIESTRPRQFQRLPNPGLLTRLGNIVVLDRRPMNDVDDAINRYTEWTDSGLSIPDPTIKWRTAFFEGQRRYRFDRFTESDYWRAFADEMKGRRGTFLLPTFFDDLPLAAQPPLNATALTTSNMWADHYLRNQSYKFVRIERQNNKVTYHRITDYKINYDTNGDPISLTFNIAASIGNTAGDNLIRKISFALLSRLNNDDITLEHGQFSSVITLDIRTVNE